MSTFQAECSFCSRPDKSIQVICEGRCLICTRCQQSNVIRRLLADSIVGLPKVVVGVPNFSVANSIAQKQHHLEGRCPICELPMAPNMMTTVIQFRRQIEAEGIHDYTLDFREYPNVLFDYLKKNKNLLGLANEDSEEGRDKSQGRADTMGFTNSSVLRPRQRSVLVKGSGASSSGVPNNNNNLPSQPSQPLSRGRSRLNMLSQGSFQEESGRGGGEGLGGGASARDGDGGEQSHFELSEITAGPAGVSAGGAVAVGLTGLNQNSQTSRPMDWASRKHPSSNDVNSSFAGTGNLVDKAKLPKSVMVMGRELACDLYTEIWCAFLRGAADPLSLCAPAMFLKICSRKKASARLVEERVRALLDCVRASASFDNCHFLLIGQILGIVPRPQDKVKPVSSFLVASMLAMVLCDRCQKNEELVSGDLQPSAAEFRAKLAKLTARMIPLKKVINALRILWEIHEPHWSLAPLKAACVEYGSPTPWMSSGITKLLLLLLHNQPISAENPHLGFRGASNQALNMWSKPPSHVIDFKMAMNLAGSLNMDLAVAIQTCIAGWLQEYAHITALVQQAMIPVVPKQEPIVPHYIGTSLTAAERKSLNKIIAYFEARGEPVRWEEFRIRAARHELNFTVPESFLEMSDDELSYHAEQSKQELRRRKWREEVARWDEDWDWNGISALPPDLMGSLAVEGTSDRMQSWALKKRLVSSKQGNRNTSKDYATPQQEKILSASGFGNSRVLDKTFSARGLTIEVSEFPAAFQPQVESPSAYIGVSDPGEGLGSLVEPFGRMSPGSFDALNESLRATKDIVQLSKLSPAKIVPMRSRRHMADEAGAVEATSPSPTNLPTVSSLAKASSYLRQTFSTEPLLSPYPSLASPSRKGRLQLDSMGSKDGLVIREDGTWREALGDTGSEDGDDHSVQPHPTFSSPSNPILVRKQVRLPTSVWSAPIPARHKPCLVDILGRHGASVLERVNLLSPVHTTNKSDDASRAVPDEVELAKQGLMDYLHAADIATMPMGRRLSGALQGALSSREQPSSPLEKRSPTKLGSRANSPIQTTIQDFVGRLRRVPSDLPRYLDLGADSQASAASLQNRLNLSRSGFLDESLMFRAPTPIGINNRKTVDLTHFVGLRPSEVPSEAKNHLGGEGGSGSTADRGNSVDCLILRDAALTPEALSDIVQKLMRPVHMSFLVKLDISGNRLGRAGIVPLAQALRVNCCLVDLCIANNGLGDAGVREVLNAIKEGGGLKKLKKLDCRGNHITCTTEDLYCLDEFAKLRVLDLSWNRITVDTKAQRELVHSILNSLPELQVLSLAYNRIQDKGCALVLSACTSLRELKVLDLAFCFLTEVSSAAITTYLRQSSVEVLMLQGIAYDRKLALKNPLEEEKLKTADAVKIMNTRNTSDGWDELRSCVFETGKRVLLEGFYSGIDLTLRFEARH